MITLPALLIALCLSVCPASATTLPPRVAAVSPVVKGTPQVLGVVNDPTLNRDSCGSALIGGRVLWTCRDTQITDASGVHAFPVISSTSSWTDLDAWGHPALNDGTLPMYGNNNLQKTFYPLLPDECGDNVMGSCDSSNTTRYAIWPDSPPLVTDTAADGTVTAYTWIRKDHIKNDLSDLTPDCATTLYKVVYSPSAAHDALPTVTVVDENFWTADEQLPYGAYGGFVANGTAYIYGKGYGPQSTGTIGLAKVSVGSIEDKSAYQFYQNDSWTATPPSVNASLSGVNIPNVSAGGQGTYYYSPPWGSYVWIGQQNLSVSADFFITTSPDPEGPWAQPIKFYSGVNGNATLPAYTIQAHTSLGGFENGANDVYLTYTHCDLVGENVVSIF
ncbi:hypothetical protein CONPUDRAFT_137859 [Coniophora puteana RWD-64-598 SS2]|uniref:DUF4185 domain-containing protein n=1 Tax=Coniophora puteana (strain RWD-64-598) TaxID=741705 RepID=A0A5M3MJY2_CONPW|nr:uncharacterized protein CONPUDRAFT_137859 [Coniophora puteana RWD-64-598 SS2]EIW79522.1 hypothetical protein CONPUDRAFT_137859 [Coniophora puteana RWD-64-598 SS2]